MEDFSHPNISIASMARRLWVHGFLSGLGVVVVIFAAWAIVRHAPAILTSEASELASLPSLSPPGQASRMSTVPVVAKATGVPLDLTAVLQVQIEALLDRLREANQHKNLDRFLEHYSPTFPELRKRTQEIARSWKIYNYPKMEFLVEEVKLLPDDRVFARVTWDIVVEDQRSKKFKQLIKTYLAWFVQESGEWRIQALEKAG